MLSLFLSLVATFAFADGEHQHPAPTPGQLKSILDMPDVDGDGYVTKADIELIENHFGSFENEVYEPGHEYNQYTDYHPLYDINADGKISHEDADEARKHLGHKSNLQDQQIVKVIKATKKYYGPNGIEAAKKDGFIPVVANAKGHGVHWANLDRMVGWFFTKNELELTKPEGLLFSLDGKFYGVHYVKVVSFYPNRKNFFDLSLKNDFAPKSFSGVPDSFWHTHVNVCGTGVGSAVTGDDPNLVFMQDLEGIVSPFPSENPSEAEVCATQKGRMSLREAFKIISENDGSFARGSHAYGKTIMTKLLKWQSHLTKRIPGASLDKQFIPNVWPFSDLWYSPKVFMLHGWFHSLNPNGKFSGEHPGIAPNAPPLPSKHPHEH